MTEILKIMENFRKKICYLYCKKIGLYFPEGVSCCRLCENLLMWETLIRVVLLVKAVTKF